MKDNSLPEGMMIYIRADANPRIGMGHVMRCLSIADAAANTGAIIKFILADEYGRSSIQERGYETVVLGTDFDQMDDEPEHWPQDMPEIVIVDSYYVTPSYLKKIKKMIGEGKLVYIDGQPSFPYPVDFLVNYNAYSPDLDYERLYSDSGLPVPHLILGTSYVPLRTMFQDIPEKKQRKTVRSVLISAGGADPEHVLLALVKKLPRDYIFHLIIGAMNGDTKEIERIASTRDHIVLHKNVKDMRSLISMCDIAVSAAGSTLYEICSCGVPLITYIIADNQSRGAEAFEKMSLAINIGDLRNTTDPASLIVKAIDYLSADYDRRVDIGCKMQQMIDGYGAGRIVRELLRSECETSSHPITDQTATTQRS